MTADRPDPTPAPDSTAEAAVDSGVDTDADSGVDTDADSGVDTDADSGGDTDAESGFVFVSFPEGDTTPPGVSDTSTGVDTDASEVIDTTGAEPPDSSASVDTSGAVGGFEFGVDLHSPEERQTQLVDVLDESGTDASSPSTTDGVEALHRATDEVADSVRCVICGTAVDTPGDRCPLCGSTYTEDRSRDGDTEEREHEREQLDPDGVTTTRSPDEAIHEAVERLRRFKRGG